MPNEYVQVTRNESEPRDEQCTTTHRAAATATQPIPSNITGFGPDRYDGLDIIQVIQLLRQRLNWDTNIDQVIDERHGKPSRCATNVGKPIHKTLYSLQDDGVFAYAVLKDLNNPVARYNPYDLVCVGAAKTFDLKQMFTVTASAVTQVGFMTLKTYFCNLSIPILILSYSKQRKNE